MWAGEVDGSYGVKVNGASVGVCNPSGRSVGSE